MILHSRVPTYELNFPLFTWQQLDLLKLLVIFQYTIQYLLFIPHICHDDIIKSYLFFKAYIDMQYLNTYLLHVVTCHPYGLDIHYGRLCDGRSERQMFETLLHCLLICLSLGLISFAVSLPYFDFICIEFEFELEHAQIREDIEDPPKARLV